MRRINRAALPLAQIVEARAQIADECLVAHEDVRFQVQRQAQRIEVARTDGGPFVVDDRDLAVEGPFAVLDDLHLRREQVAIEGACRGMGDGRIRFGGHDEADLHAATRRPPQFAQETPAGEEVRVGDDDLALRIADRPAVFALDRGAPAAVVAQFEQDLGVAGGPARGMRGRMLPAFARAVARERRVCEGEEIADDRTFQFDRVILLRVRPRRDEVIDRVIDAADEGPHAVDDQQLAMQPAEYVDADAEHAAVRVEHVHAHAGGDELGQEFGRERRRAVAVDGQVHAHAAVRGRDQRALQVAADAVFEQDEGLDDHFALRAGDGRESAREEGLAVFQQGDAVAGPPGAACARAAPGQAHHATRAARGAWSDRCDHGRVDNTCASGASTLRT